LEVVGVSFDVSDMLIGREGGWRLPRCLGFSARPKKKICPQHHFVLRGDPLPRTHPRSVPNIHLNKASKVVQSG